MKRGVSIAGSDEVSQCFSYNCCIFAEEETDSTLATCNCFDTDVACEQEAATRRRAEVVTTCPFNATPPACAAEGENCRYDYLSQNDLAGCCGGTLCRPNSSGIPVCQTAPEEELALAEECARVAHGTEINAMAVATTTVRTSHGDLTFDDVRFAFFDVGPHGCLNGFDFTLGPSGCTLSIRGSLVEGRLSVTSFTGTVNNCPGFVGESLDGYLVDTPEVVTDVAFEGLACDGHLIFESYCVAGTVTFRLNGTSRSITFEDQELQLHGVMCSSSPEGSCPVD